MAIKLKKKKKTAFCYSGNINIYITHVQKTGLTRIKSGGLCNDEHCNLDANILSVHWSVPEAKILRSIKKIMSSL